MRLTQLCKNMTNRQEEVSSCFASFIWKRSVDNFLWNRTTDIKLSIFQEGNRRQVQGRVKTVVLVINLGHWPHDPARQE